MDIEKRLHLISRGTEEIITLNELRERLETKDRLLAYQGYEPSGLIHIGWVMTVNKIKDFTDVGFDFIVLLADLHAWINEKMGGDLDKIQKVGEYFKHCFLALGVDPKRTKFMFASELVQKAGYWENVLKIADQVSLARLRRSLTIMGRSILDENLKASLLIYPPMQVTDIFLLGVDVAYGGMDQRKAHILAREVADKLGYQKPIAVHTSLLMGLSGIQKMGLDEDEKLDTIISSKMSKSRPETFVCVHDSPEAIQQKISKAFCPEKQIEFNPVLEICKYIIFRNDGIFRIERESKYGGPLELQSYAELEKIYREGGLHPLDLKNAVSENLIRLLAPVRKYFEQKPELLEILKA
ncbi:MAG: tyrosine--tRNA ligase [Euryarchaeota archaeon]|nr:tyrosine--tRNA ligase [Euryarchaeota archaeon]